MSDAKQKTNEYYLFDLGSLLKDHAREAKKEILSEDRGDDFARGRLMAYYEVISLMKEQAMAFGLPFEDLNLHDIDPEKDLL